MDFMREALRLAKKSDPFPNPKVGAVLVKNGKVIGKGYHKKPGLPHAEIEAISDAKRNGHPVKGATLYVSLEPCSHKNKRTPPCTEAIVVEGIRKVVYGMRDPNPLVSGAKRLEEKGVIVKGPVAQKKAESINRRYIEMVSRRPFVAIKMAMSADGKTATRTGDSRWISGKRSREFVYKLRAEYDAVMVGANTVRIDDPRLTARVKGAKTPLRIIVDGKLDISPKARVMKNKDGKTIIATTTQVPKKKIENTAKKSGAHVFVCGKNEVDLKALVRVLGAMGVKKILVEGGSELNASALDAGIVDKFYLFIAPKIIGGRDAKGVVGGAGIERIKQARKVRDMKTRKMGEDILLEFNF